MYDPTMASTTDGLNATAPNLQADIGNSGALGGLDHDLLAVPQPSGSGSGFSVEQADALVQSYTQLYDSQVPTLAAELEPVSSSEPTAEAMDGSDDLTGLSSNAPVITFNLPTAPSSLESSAATTSFNFGTGTENNLGTILGDREYSDRSPNTWFNVYSFSVNSDSTLDLSLENYSGHQNLFLLNDYDPGSFSFDMGQILAHSDSRQAQPNRLSGTLNAGDYHAVVLSPTAHLGYQLNVNTDPLGGIEHIQGNLTADNFEFEANTRYTVFSGEGNVNFGQGEFDLIDFSHYSLDDVIGWNPVTPDGGGMLFDNGNGLRLFDAMQLNDGHHILFEGIDRLAFADGQVDLAVTPNDPKFDQQWNLHMTGVHNAWRFTQGSEDVLIGIQDDGLEIAPVRDSNSLIGFRRDIHPDLDRSRIEGSPWRRFPGLSNSHGTAIHSIAAAASNNQIGMSGINWTSKVHHADVFVPNLSPNFLALPRVPEPGKVVEATQAMIDNSATTGRPVVINMSFEFRERIPDLESLIAENQDSALFVIATGNDNADTLSYPANLAQLYDNVVAVGASWGEQDIEEDSTEPGTRISYTEESYPDLDPSRVRWGSNYGEGLTLMAPTEVIAANYHLAGFGYNHKSNGTSSAAPHVTGIASLAWSVNPDLTASAINGIMQKTAHDLSELGDEFEYGAGLVNADAAVRKAMALANPVSNWNALGDQPLSLSSFISQSAETPVFGVTATQFEPEHPVETIVEAETGSEAVADPAGEAARPWWDRPFSLPTFDANSTWANLDWPTFDVNSTWANRDWQTPEFSVSRPDFTIPEFLAPEFSVPEFSVPRADWVPPTTDFASASLPTVDDLTSPLTESWNEPLVAAIA